MFKKSSFILYAVFSNYKWWVSIKSQKVLVTNKNKTRVDAPEKGDCRLVIDSWPLYVTIVYTDHHDFEENNVKFIVLLIRDLYCNTNNIKMRCNLRNERLYSLPMVPRVLWYRGIFFVCSYALQCHPPVFLFIYS